MTIAMTSSTARQSVLKRVPELALALAGIAVVLLALGPIGWRLGWWHFRFSLLTLMPWAAYIGLAAVIVSALGLVIGLGEMVRAKGAQLQVLKATTVPSPRSISCRQLRRRGRGSRPGLSGMLDDPL